MHLTVHGRAACAVLSRPHRGNSLSMETMRELQVVLQLAAEDEAVGVLVLRAQGRHFCAGADLDWVGALATGDADQWSEGIRSLFELLLALHDFPKPLVAAVQGTVVGGGVSMLCFFDEVIAVEEARWRLPEIKLGMVPTAVLPALLLRVPKASLSAVLYDDRAWTAHEAVSLGLATQCVGADAFEQVVANQIERWQSIPTKVFSATKNLQRQMEGRGFKRQVELARRKAMETIQSADARARISSLLDR